MPLLPADDDRRSRLLGIKLTTLVREHLGVDALEAQLSPFSPGAALIVDGAGWVLLDRAPERGLGPALAWATRAGVDDLQVIAERHTGLLARRARAFRGTIDVWHAEERLLLPAVAEPLVPPPSARVDHLALIDLIRAGGAVPNVEHGVVVGEVRGLEVCRVVETPAGDVALEVGVGAHDREAFAAMHGDVPTIEALADVVRVVTRHRDEATPSHPLNRLGAERFLRWRLERDPELIGARSVRPTEPPVPRPNLKDPFPCSALADRDGTEVGVVCSWGVDLDVVPYAADAQAQHGSTVIALRRRDLLPVTRELAARLAQPVELIGIAHERPPER